MALYGTTWTGVKDSQFPDLGERIAAAFLQRCGSIKSEMKRTGPRSSVVKFELVWDGTPVTVHVFFDGPEERVQVGVEESVALEIREALGPCIKACALRWFIGLGTISLGYKRLAEPLRVGNTLVAPSIRTRPHGMPVGPGQVSGGAVKDHLIAIPVPAYDWSSGNRRAAGQYDATLSLLAFALDHPVAAIGRAFTDSKRTLPKLKWDDVKEYLQHSGGQLDRDPEADKEPTLNAPFVTAMSGLDEFYDGLTELSERDSTRAHDVIDSYARALMLANPERGFERYEDPAVAITLWSTIVEEMAEEHGGPTSKTKKFLARIAPEVTVAEWDEIHSVRHKVAHDASRDLAAFQGFNGALLDFDAMDNLAKTIRGLALARRLARAAIIDFVARRGKDVTPAPEKAASAGTWLVKKGVVTVQKNGEVADDDLQRRIEKAVRKLISAEVKAPPPDLPPPGTEEPGDAGS